MNIGLDRGGRVARVGSTRCVGSIGKMVVEYGDERHPSNRIGTLVTVEHYFFVEFHVLKLCVTR